MFFQQLVNGLTLGSTYALVAIGFSLIFGVLKVMNFANGSIFILGAYIMLGMYSLLGGNFWLGLLLGILLTGIIGYLLDRVILRTLRNKNANFRAHLVATLAAGTIIDNLIPIIWGSESKAIPYSVTWGGFKLFGTSISYFQLVILGTAIMLMALVSLVIYKTKVGKEVLAISQNLTAAQLMGINTKLIISMVFFMSAALSTISGTLVSMYYNTLYVGMSGSYGSKVFAAAVLGGVGNIPGAIVGGLVLGVIEALGASYISSGYRNAIAFIVLIIVLLIKPTGLFGKRTYVKV